MFAFCKKATGRVKPEVSEPQCRARELAYFRVFLKKSPADGKYKSSEDAQLIPAADIRSRKQEINISVMAWVLQMK